MYFVGLFSRNAVEGIIFQNVNPLYTRGPQIELLLTNRAYEEGFVRKPYPAFKKEVYTITLN